MADRECDKYIGNMIKTIRKSLQLSQKVLADELGVTVQQICKYENGKNSITAANIRSIADFFGCNTSLFFPTQKSNTSNSSLLRVNENKENFFDKEIKDDGAVLLLKNFFSCEKEDKMKILKFSEKIANKIADKKTNDKQ